MTLNYFFYSHSKNDQISIRFPCRMSDASGTIDIELVAEAEGKLSKADLNSVVSIHE